MAGTSKPLPLPLAEAMRLWPRSGLPGRLREIYVALPATKCARRGACCGLLPLMQPVEMLSWLSEMDKADMEARIVLVLDLVRHFLLNATSRLPCPWARESSCAQYERRFFGCRAYGLWSREAYEARRGQSMEAAERVQKAWQDMGINLSANVCAPPPPYCDQVEPISGPAIDDEKLDALEAKLAHMGSDEPWHGFLTQCGGDLSYLVAGLALGWQKCLQAKVAVTKALLAGDAKQAQTYLSKAEEETRLWGKELAVS
jgi:hypothetical protein